MAEKFLKSLEGELKRNTILAYRQGLRHFNSYRKGRRLSGELIAGFVRYLEDRDLAPKSQHTYLTGVNRYLNYLVEQHSTELDNYLLYMEISAPLRDHLSDLPIGNQTDTELPPDGDIKEILSYLESGSYDGISRRSLAWYRDRAIIHFFLWTGLRPAEVARLCLWDINWKSGEVTIAGKRDKEWPIILPEQVLRICADYISHRNNLDLEQDETEPDELPLFARHDRRSGKEVLSLSTRTIENIFQARSKEAGLDPAITPRQMRHYFVTKELVMTRAIALRQVGEKVGHSTLQSTEIYAHD
jgi:site-specific recombinase XerD